MTYSSTEQNTKGGLWPSYGTEDNSRGRALYFLSSSALVAPNANYMSTVHVLYHEKLTVKDETMREDLLSRSGRFKNF